MQWSNFCFFFFISIPRKIFKTQKILSVLFAVRKFLNHKNDWRKWKKCYTFPHFRKLCDKQKKKNPGTVTHVYTYTAQLIIQVSQVIFPTKSNLIPIFSLLYLIYLLAVCLWKQKFFLQYNVMSTFFKLKLNNLFFSPEILVVSGKGQQTLIISYHNFTNVLWLNKFAWSYNLLKILIFPLWYCKARIGRSKVTYIMMGCASLEHQATN